MPHFVIRFVRTRLEAMSAAVRMDTVLLVKSVQVFISLMGMHLIRATG